jgi:hypothetical protein
LVGLGNACGGCFHRVRSSRFDPGEWAEKPSDGFAYVVNKSCFSVYFTHVFVVLIMKTVICYLMTSISFNVTCMIWALRVVLCLDSDPDSQQIDITASGPIATEHAGRRAGISSVFK